MHHTALYINFLTSILIAHSRAFRREERTTLLVLHNSNLILRELIALLERETLTPALKNAIDKNLSKKQIIHFGFGSHYLKTYVTSIKLPK